MITFSASSLCKKAYTSYKGTTEKMHISLSCKGLTESPSQLLCKINNEANGSLEFQNIECAYILHFCSISDFCGSHSSQGKQNFEGREIYYSVTTGNGHNEEVLCLLNLKFTINKYQYWFKKCEEHEFSCNQPNDLFVVSIFVSMRKS
jgi:hypothetical protein